MCNGYFSCHPILAHWPILGSFGLISHLTKFWSTFWWPHQILVTPPHFGARNFPTTDSDARGATYFASLPFDQLEPLNRTPSRATQGNPFTNELHSPLYIRKNFRIIIGIVKCLTQPQQCGWNRRPRSSEGSKPSLAKGEQGCRPSSDGECSDPHVYEMPPLGLFHHPSGFKVVHVRCRLRASMESLPFCPFHKHKPAPGGALKTA
jgi:hypothetical protein